MAERTDADILIKLATLENDPRDFFGFVRSDLIGYLPFDAAKPFLKDEATAEQWDQMDRSALAVSGQIADYMPFAWGKANGRRGLSAGRSLCHMSAWLWMLGHDEAAESVLEYDHYGKPQLRAICEQFGIDWRALDDGKWSNSEFGGHAAPKVGIKIPFAAIAKAGGAS